MNEFVQLRICLSGKVLFLIFVYILRLLLDILYVTYVHPVWEHKGFDFEINYGQYLESWMLFVIVSLFLPHALKKPSDLFLCVLGICMLLPMSSLHGLAGEPRWIIYYVLCGYFVIVFTRAGNLPNLPIIDLGPQIAVIISLLMVAVVILWMLLIGMISDEFINNFRHVLDSFILKGEAANANLMGIEEYRKHATELINQGVFGYLNSWTVKVFNIFLFAYALYRKYWFWAMLSFCVQIFLFGVIAQKAIVVFPFILLVIWFYFRKNNALMMFPIGVSSLILVTVFIWQISSDVYSFPISLIVRRIFFVAANNVYDYFIFFSQNAHVYWSNSITKDWIDYPYLVSYPNLIGDYQASLLEGRWAEDSISRGVYVNSSFIATGYMHAGFTGLILYCVIVGFLFRLIDALSFRTIPPWFALSITIIPMVSLLISADLPTALLTHGGIASIILLFMFRDLSVKNT